MPSADGCARPSSAACERLPPNAGPLGRPTRARAASAQPFFETSASHYIKPSFHCLDLGGEAAVNVWTGTEKVSMTAVDVLKRFEGVAKPPEALAKQGSYWHGSGRPGCLAAFKDRRLPPLVPAEARVAFEPTPRCALLLLPLVRVTGSHPARVSSRRAHRTRH